VGDGASAAAVIGSAFDYLPRIVAVAALVWYVILIYESRTGQAVLRRLMPARAKEEEPPTGHLAELVDHEHH
jgi:hypothetical protein